MASSDLVRQPSLFDAEPALDASFAALRRIPLDDESWVDIVPGWLRGDGAVFDEIADAARWEQRTRWMYTREVIEPRLTARWSAGSGSRLEPAVLEHARQLLGQRYSCDFDSMGINLYRDGRDSVAWHRDKIPVTITEPIVALVSLGARRAFALRPRETPRAGRTLRFELGGGDLLVTGGLAQRRWEHTVPKVRAAGPRISLAFRHSV
jgi:alkylated DNA repair dioxygenase AlkB